MLDPYQLTMHTLTLRQRASAEQLAEITGQPVDEVGANLEKAVADGAVLVTRSGDHVVTPAGRTLLDEAYPTAFADLRGDAAVVEAMDAFESGVNPQMLALTTDWQTKEVGGERVPNDHADAEYDARIVDRLGRVHERTEKVLRPLAVADPLVDRFLDRVGAALTRAEGGATEYVSGMRVDSVHTVWFQMHEHLLRLTGRERSE